MRWADCGLTWQVLAGGVAGASAAAVTNPLDVVKTRLQLDGIHSPRSVATNRIVRPSTCICDLALLCCLQLPLCLLARIVQH